jgi:hypothetical protein
LGITQGPIFLRFLIRLARAASPPSFVHLRFAQHLLVVFYCHSLYFPGSYTLDRCFSAVNIELLRHSLPSIRPAVHYSTVVSLAAAPLDNRANKIEIYLISLPGYDRPAPETRNRLDQPCKLWLSADSASLENSTPRHHAHTLERIYPVWPLWPREVFVHKGCQVSV